MSVSERIKELRSSAGLTRKELAYRAGLAEISIRKYEKGERNPKIAQLEKLAAALGCTTDYLLGNVDRPHKYILSDEDSQRAFGGLDEAIEKVLENSQKIKVDETGNVKILVERQDGSFFQTRIPADKLRDSDQQ